MGRGYFFRLSFCLSAFVSVTVTAVHDAVKKLYRCVAEMKMKAERW